MKPGVLTWLLLSVMDQHLSTFEVIVAGNGCLLQPYTQTGIVVCNRSIGECGCEVLQNMRQQRLAAGIVDHK